MFKYSVQTLHVSIAVHEFPERLADIQQLDFFISDKKNALQKSKLNYSCHVMVHCNVAVTLFNLRKASLDECPKNTYSGLETDFSSKPVCC